MILEIPPVTAGDITIKAQQAREAQGAWKRRPLEERLRALRLFWRKIEENRTELLRTLHGDTGKPRDEMENMELAGAEAIFKYFTRNARSILADRAAPTPWILLNKRAFIHYVPRGIIVLITPWNVPFLIPFGDTLPALIAGNAVMLKPSSRTPHTALFLESLIRQVPQIPENLFQVIPAKGSEGEGLLEEADMVLFTGSVATGRRVYQKAAERKIPCVLELGGKHPFLVFRDAPLKRAAKAAVWGAFANCGQLCIGVERVFVAKEIYGEFASEAALQMSALRQGVDLHQTLDLGRMIFPGQLETVLSHLQDAQAKGARVIGGRLVDAGQGLLRPALILDADLSMRVMQEETFGPVLAAMPVENEEEAVSLANALPLGLAASVWTKDLEKGEAIAKRIEAGTVCVNDVLTHYAVAGLPFGGVKQSGLGRRHSEEGLRMFCQEQALFIHEWPKNLPDLWWFPYRSWKSRWTRWLSKLS